MLIMAHCNGLLGRLNTAEPSLILTLVKVKMSVKKACCIYLFMYLP